MLDPEKEIISGFKILESQYSKETNNRFFYLEEFVESATDKPSYRVEITKYEKREPRNFGDEKLSKIGQNLWIKRRTSISTIEKNGNTEIVLTGQQIANRLFQIRKMIQIKYIQPPGLRPNGKKYPPFQIRGIHFDVKTEKNEYPSCCEYPVKRLQNARFLGTKMSMEDVKALQTILQRLGYEKELSLNENNINGMFDENTKRAVIAFIDDTNREQKDKKIKFPKSEKITKIIAESLVSRCKEGWRRPTKTHRIV